MFKNAPPGWAIKLVKHIYSNDLIKLFEDTLDLDGEEKVNIFVAYGLDNKANQSLGKMEKIVIDTITINEIKRLLSQGKILNAASIVAFYKALDFHERHMMY